MVHTGSAFVPGIHPSRTWYQDLFESMQWNVCMHRQWNVCMHRQDLSLYSHPKEFLGIGVRTHVDLKGKTPTTRCSYEDQTHDAASLRTASPTRYWLSYSIPKYHIHDPSYSDIFMYLSSPILLLHLYQVLLHSSSNDTCVISWSFSLWWGFPTRMVYLYYMSCLRYTILVGNPWCVYCLVGLVVKTSALIAADLRFNSR